MMKDANVGVAKDKWKPPAGYKSAIGKARDLARAASPKPRAKAKARPGAKKVNAITESKDPSLADNTASESDFSDGEIHALRRFTPVSNGTPLTHSIVSPPERQICAMSKFQVLDEAQVYDADVLDSLNDWAHRVRVKPPAKTKTPSAETREIDKLSNYVSSNKKPHSQIVVVHNEKDLDKASNLIRPLPTDRKSIHKMCKTFSSHVKLGQNEKLAMVDSGSFCHAIDAETELPTHAISQTSNSEGKGDGEAACGSVIKRLGKVKTRGSVEGVPLNVHWNAMKVKVPILSVRRLVHDQHSVRFNHDGGYIRNLHTRQKNPFL